MKLKAMPMTSRLKIIAKLDISEKRLPQDGRIMLKINVGGRKKELDFRVSAAGAVGREDRAAVLDKENLRLDMTKLGFEPESLAKFEEAIFKPYGISPRDRLCGAAPPHKACVKQRHLYR